MKCMGELQDFHFNPPYKWILKELTNLINVFIFHLLILAYFLAKWIWDYVEDKLDGCHLMNSIAPSYTPCIIIFITSRFNICLKIIIILNKDPNKTCNMGFIFKFISFICSIDKYALFNLVNLVCLGFVIQILIEP